MKRFVDILGKVLLGIVIGIGVVFFLGVLATGIYIIRIVFTTPDMDLETQIFTFVMGCFVLIIWLGGLYLILYELTNPTTTNGIIPPIPPEFTPTPAPKAEEPDKQPTGRLGRTIQHKER